MKNELDFQKHPRKPILTIFDLIDKLKFALNIKPDSKLMIVSAADSTHFKSLVQFIKSVQYYENYSQLVVYDLGMTTEEADYIRRNFPAVSFRVFDYSKYPSYFNVKVDAGKFAWKPVIISDVLKEFECSTIWFDAGCKLTQPLYRIRNIIKKHGFYSPIALPVTIKAWAHPQFLKFLNASEEIVNRISFNSAMVAINYNHAIAMKLIEKWKAAALDENCTAPKGSSKKLHRFQTIMSILAYQLGLPGDIPHKCMGFLVQQDID